MFTMWQWCTILSMSAAAMTSSPSTRPQSSNPLLEVSTVEACSYLRLMSWKNNIAPVWLTGM